MDGPAVGLPRLDVGLLGCLFASLGATGGQIGVSFFFGGCGLGRPPVWESVGVALWFPLLDFVVTISGLVGRRAVISAGSISILMSGVGGLSWTSDA